MKKLFLLISAFAITLLANAAVIHIDNTTANAVQTALNAAASGDIIEMAAGTYEESGNYLAFTGKELTVRAAEGAEVIIRTVCPVRLKEGAKAEFINVKFDCSTIGGYDYVIVAADDTDNKRVVLTGCEFYGWEKNKAMIEATSSRRLAAVTIDKCYFHDCMKSVVFIENTGSIDLSITNSTFANIATNNESFSAGVIDSRASSGSFLVDHCTFYNVLARNTDYAAIGKVATPGAVVSNCIFVLPTSTDGQRAIRDVAQANNCLTFNYLKDSGRGIHGDVAQNNCIFADPLFTDAANGDYSFAGNWVTMQLSPARAAATDGSDLGDPRWYSAEVLPSTDFAPSYVFLGEKAVLSGSFALNGDNYIQSQNTTTVGLAVWKIQAERKCIVDVTLNIAADNTSGHRYEVALYDADNNLVGTALAEPSNSWSAGDKVLGSFEIPAAGKYTIKLTNDCNYSSTIIEGVTFTYVGGDVQAMPGTTNINDAWFSAQGTRADGKIDFPDGYIQDGWVKWNVSFADAANYNVTVNIDNENGHNYTVALYRSETDESPIVVSEGAQKSTIGTLELGAMEVPAGNYIMKVTNATQYSDAKLISVNFAYAGGAAVDLSKTTPASLQANADAILSDDWSIENGKIVHAESKALTGWAKWNVNSADDGNYNVTVNIESDNGHLLRVEVFEDENAPAIYTLDEAEATKYSTGALAIDLGNIALENKEYVVKVSNTQPYSHVQIVSIVISYKNGAVQNIPGALTLTDALLSAKAYIENDMLYFAPHDCGTIPDEWAKWNLHVADADVYQFSVNVTSPNGQKYTIVVKDEDGNEVYNLVQTSSLGSGDRSFTTDMMYLASGNYTLEMRNNYPYSDGHLVSISAAAVADVLTIDENAIDNSVIHNNYRNGNHTIRLIRTIKADMYNTICLPFDVSSSKLPAIFGSDVELKQMSSAELDGNVLNLIFDDATSIYRGTPYLIKTSSDVVNPIFTEVEIKEEAGQATSGTNADFIGNFIKSEVPAGENNLFLGPDNLLYFSQTATPIKGMRAYFQVKGVPNPMQAIKHARIVMNGQVATEINLVNAEQADSQKRIENGQLIIIRDGVRYNVMGTVIK